MGFLDAISGKLRNLFSDDNDELLFFVLIFLILSSKSSEIRDEADNTREDGLTCKDDSRLFFVILLVMLLIGRENVPG